MEETHSGGRGSEEMKMAPCTSDEKKNKREKPLLCFSLFPPVLFFRLQRDVEKRDYLKMRVAAIPKAIASTRRKTQMCQSLRPRVGSRGMCGIGCCPEEGGRGVGRRTLAGV